MARAQQGDRDSYRALLDDIGPIVRQYVGRRLRNPEDANDVCQDVLLALHRARHTYEPSRPFEPWLFAIVRRIVARRQSEQAARYAREIYGPALPSGSVGSDGHMKVVLEQAFEQLSPAQRQAITLLKIDGLSLDAAAPRAGTTVGALKVRAHRAYRALRRLL
jgi:RNA polymerase sigma-70 factor (ECF subfamily)